MEITHDRFGSNRVKLHQGVLGQTPCKIFYREVPFCGAGAVSAFLDGLTHAIADVTIVRGDGLRYM